MPREARPNCIVVLGPTASGKTALGVRLAHAVGGEVVSADSRQVYRGLDIGSGKDLDEYVVDGEPVAYHLIDIEDLAHEFSVFDYQRACFDVIETLWARETVPVVVGGTGMYLEAVLKGYRMVDTPEDPVLRAALAELDEEALAARLRALKPGLHNTTDLENRSRTIRAIEIAEAERSEGESLAAPAVRPLVLGTRWPRAELHVRIAERLKARLDAGLVEEVQGLLKAGVPADRLRTLGLEYRFVTDFLAGRIRNRNDLFQKLNSAIRNFAKRQETWFRRMERNGIAIAWIERAEWGPALALVHKEFPDRTTP